MALTRTFGPRSAAISLVSCASAAFAVWWDRLPLVWRYQPTDVMLMTEAPGRSSIEGSARRVISNGEATISVYAFMRSSTRVSTKGGEPPAPALLTSTSIPPNSSNVRSTIPGRVCGS